MKLFRQITTFPLLVLIKLYQWILSPAMGVHCRFHPSCSAYAAAALKKYGLIKGLVLAAKRIGRCHPGGGQGYDPLP
jgi:hypothetical protein